MSGAAISLSIDFCTGPRMKSLMTTWTMDIHAHDAILPCAFADGNPQPPSGL